jgi:hypothetical protein
MGRKQEEMLASRPSRRVMRMPYFDIWSTSAKLFCKGQTPGEKSGANVNPLLKRIKPVLQH